LRNEYRFGPKITVKGYYERWIKSKKNLLIRPSALADYKQHFSGYLLSEFGSSSMAQISVSRLSTFRSKLLDRGLSVKTCRNLLDGSFRAMWRDAMIEGIVETNPFALLQWPRQPKHRPDPFTIDERDKIVQWWAEHDFFFYPYVFFQFHTGCRPSETAALTWANIETGRVAIRGSLVMGEQGATKTEGADRTIRIGEAIAQLLSILPSRELGLQYVFVGKRGKPMTKKWAEHNWKGCLEALSIRHRPFRATRHTFITEAVRRGDNLKAIADYCGTSMAMIERDYCARETVGTISEQPKLNLDNLKGKSVAGPGLNPYTKVLPAA